MTRGLLIVVLGASLVFSGCSAVVSRGTQPVAPVSYAKYEGQAARSVGLLRNLLMVPLKYEYRKDGKNLDRETAEAKKVFGTMAENLLRDWRGYQLSNLAPDHAPPPGELYAWALTAAVDTLPPVEVREWLQAVGRQQNADGILVLQGYQKPADRWVVNSVFLTASLTWPLLLTNAKGEIDAAVFETSSGRLVFKSQVKLFDPSKPIGESEVAGLISPIEMAAPAVLTRP
jgi:hypothetical protein